MASISHNWAPHAENGHQDVSCPPPPTRTDAGGGHSRLRVRRGVTLCGRRARASTAVRARCRRARRRGRCPLPRAVMLRGCRRHRAHFESSTAHRAELTLSSSWHSACVCREPVNTLSPTHAQVARSGFVKPAGSALAPPPSPKPVVGFHGAVSEFKRRLIEATLTQSGGNRTRAAKALGLQRTYLLRLMREFQVHVPASQSAQRRPAATASPTPPEPSWR